MAGAGGSERESGADPLQSGAEPGGRRWRCGAAPERLRPSPRGRWRRPARSRREAKGGGPPLRRVSAVGHVAPAAVCPQRPRGVVSRVPPPAACPPWWCVVSAVSPAMESAQPDVSLSAMSPRQPYPPVNLIPLSAMSPNQPCPPPSSTISPVSRVPLSAMCIC